MSKRNATFQLTDRNWAEELDPEEAGAFSVASVDELKRRPIKKAKRRGILTGDDSESTSFTAELQAPKSAFTGFAGFGSKPAHANTTNPSFSLFAKQSSAGNGSISEAAKPTLFPSSVATTKLSTTVKLGSKQPDDSTTANGESEGDNPNYLEHLKALNECVLSWIQQHVSKNPYCILTPIFTDYGKHLGEIEKKYPNLKTSEQSPSGASSSSSNKPAGKGFSFSQSVATTSGQGFSFPQTTTISSAIPKKSNFSFGATAPTSVSTTTASSFPKVGFFNIGSSSTSSGSPPHTTPNTGFFNIGSSSPSDGSPTKTGTGSTALPKAGFFTAGSTTTASGTSPTTTITSTLPKAGLFNFASSVASGTATDTTASSSSGFNFSSTKTSNEKGSDGQPGIVPFSGFKFAGNTTDVKPSFTFGSAVGQETKTNAPETNEGEEEYVPPKPEVSEVTEEGAVYTKRCKLFYQKDGAWTEKGLGNLHLKDVDGKIQLIIRADTSLGNVLLNIIITESTPLKRQGKNNVSLICVPNPPLDPKQEGLKTPVPMLIRVKTGEDADELVDKINDLTK